MKTLRIFSTLGIVVSLLFLISCGKEGPAGQPGNANVIYSQWYTPNVWNGQTGDWYFDISNTGISQDIVEHGIILAYASLPGDIYPAAVRPLPAWALGSNWDFLIPDYGQIEFTSDALTKPGTTGYTFRFVLVPANNSLKSSGGSSYADQLRKMSYLEICKKFGIPE